MTKKLLLFLSIAFMMQTNGYAMETNKSASSYRFGDGILNISQPINKSLSGPYDQDLVEKLNRTAFISGGLTCLGLACLHHQPIDPTSRLVVKSFNATFKGGLGFYLAGFGLGLVDPSKETKKAKYECYAIGHLSILANRLIEGRRFVSPLFFGTLAAKNIYEAYHS